MKTKRRGWRKIPGWKDGDVSDEDVSEAGTRVNSFYLRITTNPIWGEYHFRGEISANGCCERVEHLPSGWARYYDYSDESTGKGYGSPHNEKKIDKDIETPEDLAKYLEEYANALSVDEWVEECKKQEPSYFTAR